MKIETNISANAGRAAVCRNGALFQRSGVRALPLTADRKLAPGPCNAATHRVFHTAAFRLRFFYVCWQWRNSVGLGRIRVLGGYAH